MPTLTNSADSNDVLLAAKLDNQPPVTPTEPAGPAPKRPDITPAQIVAGVPVLANLLAAFGVFTMTAAQQAALQDTLGWALALIGADAIIRVGRSIGLRR